MNTKTDHSPAAGAPTALTTMSTTPTPPSDLPRKDPDLDVLVFQHGSIATALEELEREGRDATELWGQLEALTPPIDVSETIDEIDQLGDEQAREDAHIARALLHTALRTPEQGILEELAYRDEVLLRNLNGGDPAATVRGEGEPEAEVELPASGKEYIDILRNDLWRQARVALEQATLRSVGQGHDSVTEAKRRASSLPSVAPRNQTLRSRLALEIAMEGRGGPGVETRTPTEEPSRKPDHSPMRR